MAGTVGSMGRGRCHAEQSADGRFIAAGGADGSVFVWDTTAAAGSKEAVTVLRDQHKDGVLAAGWTSNCATLVTCDKAGVVVLWQCA